MAHHGTLKDAPISAASEDVRGSHVYGWNDEKLGKIDDVIFDHSTGDIHYVVVDTRGLAAQQEIPHAGGGTTCF